MTRKQLPAAAADRHSKQIAALKKLPVNVFF
jgi:hypothetical protein